MKLAAIVAALLAAAIAAGALLELAARLLIVRRGRYYVWPPWSRVRMELDREALPMLEAVTRFDINGDGERGDPVPRDARALFRVLVAGGSAAECYFLDQASSWPGVLQSLLNEPAALEKLGARRVHVGNIARSLVPCEAVFAMFQRVLPRYQQLDLVLLMVGASDVVHWLERRTPPVLELGRLDPTSTFALHPGGPFGWHPNRLALRRIASRVWHTVFRPVQTRRDAGQRFRKLRQMRRDAREWIDETPDPKPLLDYFERNFRALIEEARSRGIRVVVVRQPWFDKHYSPEEDALMWNFAVGRPYVEPTTSYYTHRAVFRLLRAVDARAAAISAELGVEAIDLMPSLERSLETYYDTLHFTPRGARAVAEALARHLLA